ncbi:MAG: hypothetical protein NTU81_00260 [Candidatus Nomurabacteria bacterium]|nr:hypothetical protein [Candidatus Nomurabacteria bacterium]
MKKNIIQKNIKNIKISASRFFSSLITKKQNGYAILFTVVIVSAIAVISAGLSSTAYKQLILSSLAKDSQTAFYQADSADDCALYADRVERAITPTNLFTVGGGAFACGNQNSILTAGGSEGDEFGNTFTTDTIYPSDETSLSPCFRIEISKTTNPVGLIKTKISSKGYNLCDKNNIRTVEREIVVNFEE